MVNYNLKSLCSNVDCFSEKNFVGIDFEKDSKKIIFPLWYRIPDDDYNCRISIINLIKSLSRSEYYSRDFWSNVWNSYELPINSYLRILNDYLKNWLYYDIEKEYTQNHSWKINWRRTLHTKAYISNWNLIFLEPFVERKSHESSILTIIHSYCVKKSIEEIWWLFWNIKIPFTSFSEKNIQHYIVVLNQELTKAFDDRKKLLIIHLKRILEESTNEENNISNKKYWTENYEYAWEYMVNEVFWNKNPEDFLPWTYRHIIKRNETLNDSKLRPDTILAFNDSLYILDSKYYKFWVTGIQKHLPHWESIQKQITYWDFAVNNKKYKNVYNAFILPYNKDNNPFGVSWNIEYLGFARSDRRIEKDKPSIHDHIALILLDTKYLIDSFVWNEIKDTELLINSIEKIIGSYNDESK